MNNHKRLFCIMLLVFGLIIGLVFDAVASPGRTYGLGLTTDDLAWMLSAEEGYFLDNPAILQQLSPEIWAELADTEAGLLLNPVNNMSLYLLTGLPAGIPGAFNAPIPASGILPALSDELIRVGLGLSLSSFDLGFSVGVATTSGSDATAGTTEDHQNLVINFSGGIALNFSKQMSLDAAAGGTYWGLKRHYEATPNNNYDANDFDIYALGRLNWELFSQNMFHIYGKYSLLNRGSTSGGTATASNDNVIRLGFSDEIQLLENVLILAGGFFDANFSNTAGTAGHGLSATGQAGAEVGFTKNFIGRVGIIKNLWSQTYTPGTETTSNDSGATTIVCGIGILFDNFALDTNISNALFLDGPNFITGVNSGAWSAQLSLTYYFENAGNQKK